MRKTLIVIPAFNEESTLLSVIQGIRLDSLDHEVLVVDDGSYDSTKKIAVNHADFCISHPFNLGVGASMRTAFKFAKSMNYEAVVQIDGDGQHKADSISKLLAKLDSADVVIGSRFGNRSTFRVSAPKRIGIRLLSMSIHKASGFKLKDPTSGNRAANTRAIEIFAQLYPTEYLGDTVGSIQLSGIYGLRVIECDVEMLERQGGEPSQNFLNSVKYFIRIILYVLLVGNRKSKIGKPS